MTSKDQEDASKSRREEVLRALNDPSKRSELLFGNPRKPGIDRATLDTILEATTGEKLRAVTCHQFLLGLQDRVLKAAKHHDRMFMVRDEYDQKTHRAMSIVILYSAFDKLDFEVVAEKQRVCFEWLGAVRHLACHAVEIEVLEGHQDPNAESEPPTEDGVIPFAHSKGPSRQFFLTEAAAKEGWVGTGILPLPLNPLSTDVIETTLLVVQYQIIKAIAQLENCEHCGPSAKPPGADFKVADCQLFGYCRESIHFRFPCDASLLQARTKRKAKVSCPNRCGRDRARRSCKVGQDIHRERTRQKNA